MPLDIGIVYWVCLAMPRTSFYIPFHFGISDFPAGFRSKSQRPSMPFYQSKVGPPFKADSLQAFWTFSNFREKVDGAPAEVAELARIRAEQIEKSAFATQRAIEEAVCRAHAQDKTATAQTLANYSNGIYMSSLEAMEGIVNRIAGAQ
jgi:dipeptidase